MAKPLPPEVLALVPNGIENLVLRCVICGDPLPPSRRTVGDHAGPCHKVRVLYRRFVIQLTKCISCLHPSTPQEREEYKAWRKHRGDLREKGGRPKKTLDSPEVVCGQDSTTSESASGSENALYDTTGCGATCGT